MLCLRIKLSVELPSKTINLVSIGFNKLVLKEIGNFRPSLPGDNYSFPINEHSPLLPKFINFLIINGLNAY